MTTKLPLKSVPTALLFCVFLGPVGMLYSTVIGGTIMIMIGFIVACAKFFIPMAIVWLLSCIWGVAATNRFNKKQLS
jgi:hypothetical protein